MPEEKRALTFGIHTFASPGQGVAPVWPTKDASYSKYREKNNPKTHDRYFLQSCAWPLRLGKIESDGSPK